MGERLLPIGDPIFETDGVRQTSLFTYSRAWMEHPMRVELAPSLPLTSYPHISTGNRENRHAALPCALSDTLPDSWGRGIITQVLGGTPTELDFLLSGNDSTRIGALRFLNETGELQAQWTTPVPRMNRLSDLCKLNVTYESHDDNIKDIAREILGSSGSLGGGTSQIGL